MSRRPHFTLVVGIALLGALACGNDSTGPSSNAVVRLTADPTLTLNGPDRGVPRVQCDVRFSAWSVGGTVVHWRDGEFQWYMGPSHLKPADSTAVSASEIGAAWGSADLRPDTVETARWEFTAEVPFEVAIEVHYTVGTSNRVETATTRLSCGPVPPPNLAPPTLGSLAVQPSRTPVESGDTLYVSYQGTSPWDLWEEEVAVTGAFQWKTTFQLEQTTQTTRSLAIPIPPTANLDSSIVVQVGVMDAAGQVTGARIDTRIRLVDRTRPTLMNATFGDSWGPITNVPAAAYPVGATMTLYVVASDNRAPAWVYYELSGAANVRDSLPAPSTRDTLQWNITLPAKAEWAGRSSLAVYVRDAAGLSSDTLRSSPGGVEIYPTVQPVARSGAIPSSLDSDRPLLVDWKRDRLYLLQESPKRIAVFSLATMAPDSAIALAAVPSGMDLTASGDSLVIALAGARSLAVVDLTRADRPVTTVPLTLLDSVGAGNPQRVGVASNGKAMVYLDAADPAGETVAEYDLGTGATRMRKDIGSLFSLSLALPAVGETLDHSQLLAFTTGCMQRYVAATDAFSACGRKTAGTYAQPTADLAGQRFAWGTEIFGASLDSALVLPVVQSAAAVALSADGKRVYVGGYYGITVIDAVTGAYIERFPIGQESQQILVSPDGLHLVAIEAGASGYDRTVEYIDAPTP